MKESIDSLYQSYLQDVYRFLLSLCKDHHTAEDLVQETFYRAYLHLENAQGDRVKAWLLTIAYHVFVDFYRKQKRLQIKDQHFFSKIFDRRKNTEQRVLVNETIQEVIDALEHLPATQKAALLLHDFYQLSYQEAADELGVTLSHYKVLLFRARQKIRQQKRRREYE